MKRWIFKLVVFLLLAAIVNVAVAWGCAVWVNPFAPFMLNLGEARNWGWGFDSHDRPEWWIEYWRFFGGMRIYSRPSTHGFHMLLRESRSEFEVVDAPRWSRVSQPITAGEMAKNQEIVEDARGWPLLTLSSEFELNQQSDISQSWQTNFGMQLPSDRGVMSNRLAARAIPLRPIWTGFVINTAFYAAIIAILWLLTLGPFTARRMIRRKRGHCINCGYDLRGDFSAGCPECGWQRESLDESKG